MGLDLSVTPPPPPLTSFTGSKSRILPFLTRCQTERTTLIFGDRSSIDNYFVSTFAPGGSTDTLLARALIAKHSLKFARVFVRPRSRHSQLSTRVIERNHSLDGSH